MKKQSRLDVRKFSFSQRTINVWNTLSAECVQPSSVNMFKKKIDKYLVNPVDPMRPHVSGTYLPDAPACARHSIMIVEVSPSAE